MADAKRELTPKQERFCQEYIKDLNATQAAIRAGYSADTAESQGSRLLSYAKVSERIAQLKGRQAKRLEVSADDVLLELKRLALVDISQAYDSAGFLKPIHEIPEDVRRAMVGLETSEIFAGQGDERSIIGHAKKARFADKNRALELLGKHLALFTERHEHSGPAGGPIETRDLSRLPDAELEERIAQAIARREGRS